MTQRDRNCDRNSLRATAMPRRKPGFTLVETLVVVLVIGLLVGVLVPALRMTQRTARQTACQVNLRQMIVASLAYANSNHEAMPAAVLHFMDSGVVRTVCWDFQRSANGEPMPGPLWQYTNTPHEIQQCPDYVAPEPDAESEAAGSSGGGGAGGTGDPFTGYNYNTSFVGHEGSYPYQAADGTTLDGWRAARMGTPVPAFARPERTAVFGDGGWKGGTNKFMRAPGNSVEGSMSVVCAGTQAFRHVGGCTCCAYMDGHVGIVAQPAKGRDVSDALATWVTGFPRNGFLSEDDSAYGPR